MIEKERREERLKLVHLGEGTSCRLEMFFRISSTRKKSRRKKKPEPLKKGLGRRRDPMQGERVTACTEIFFLNRNLQ